MRCYSIKAIVVFLVVSLTLLSVDGQVDEIDFDPDQIDIFSDSDSLYSVFSDEKEDKKFKIGFSIGASFSYSPNNYYSPSYYAAPTLNYKVNPRFILSAGIAMEYSTIYPIGHNENSQNQMLPMTRAYLFASGTYLVNQRLSVSGSAYKAVDYVPNRSNNIMPDFNYQGVSMGVNYKITPSFSVGFHMKVQDGIAPAYGPGMGYSPGMGNGFGAPSFGQGWY